MKVKPQKHLINILKCTKDHHPNFTLFLGAGTSISSGVKSASGMIDDWRKAYIDMHGEQLLAKQPWYDKTNEYSELFESLYDQPTQRREYIESCITSAIPSWGYVYLVNLLKEKHFNTIFTTNFDDLINEACYTFSNNLRPVVCAHDSSIKSIRLTSNRPKIIKLHGDFLFDNIKNTIRELESLEDNMRSKFRQYANEFGMIVIGYSGHDRSIMDTLNTLLHSHNCFPHGIYWCIRDDDDSLLSEELKNLARFPRFHLIKITGFDELMAELHDALGCKLQEEVADPYTALSKKLDKYFMSQDDDDDELSSHHVINNDMKSLSDHVRRVHSVNNIVKELQAIIENADPDVDSQGITDSIQRMLKETKFSRIAGYPHLYSTPNILLASSAFRTGDYQEAIDFCKSHIEHGPSIEALIIIARSAIKLSNEKELKYSLDEMVKIKSLKGNEVSRVITTIVDLISEGMYEESLKLLDFLGSVTKTEKHEHFITLNRALVARLQQGELPAELKKQLSEMLENSSEDYWLAFGLSLLLENDDVALKNADYLSESEMSAVLTIDMPIFTLISGSLYGKVRELAQSKGYEIPDQLLDEGATEILVEDGTDVDISDGLNQVTNYETTEAVNDDVDVPETHILDTNLPISQANQS